MPNTKSKTDWERVKRDYDSDAPIVFNPEDELYDPNDDAAVEAFLATATVTRGVRGPQKAPTKQLTSIRLSRPVLDHFKATGPGWQARIDDALLGLVKRADRKAKRQ